MERYIHFHGLEELILSIHTKVFNRHITIPIKIPMAFFTEQEKSPKIVWNHKEQKMAQKILQGEGKNPKAYTS